MDLDETIFPMDVTDEDPSSLPWNFRPEGYLVVIVPDVEEARGAETTLTQAGFALKDIKLYTGRQILENQAVYMGRRSVMTKLAAAVLEDVEGRELYLAYARDDRSAMWVRLHDEGRVAQALRVLGDFDWLHARATSAKTSSMISTSPDVPDGTKRAYIALCYAT